MTRPTTRPTTGQVSGVLPAERVPGQVRAARLNRPLAEHSFDPTYADAHLERLVRDAADDARESARAQGYALGWAEGQRAAAEQARTDREALARAEATRREAESVAVRSAVRSLETAAASVQQAEAEAWEPVADGLTEAAVRIVEAVLARELAATEPAVLESVRTALRTLGGGLPTVRLNPADLATVRTAPAGAVPEGVALVADPSVAAGTAVARLDDAQVLVDLPAVLDRIEGMLRG